MKPILLVNTSTIFSPIHSLVLFCVNSHLTEVQKTIRFPCKVEVQVRHLCRTAFCTML